MLSVYVSSTYSDLKDYRKVVIDTVRRMQHHVVCMEDYGAGDDRPLAKCLRDVDACDVYIGLVAWRYGFVPSHDNPHGRSITELEYRQAREQKKPCLMFLIDVDQPWPPAFMDTGPDRARLDAFRAELSDKHLVSFFRQQSDLAAQAATAVHNWMTARGPASPPGGDPPPAEPARPITLPAGLQRAFRGHGDAVECVALSADGLKAASGSWDKSVRVWDLAAGRLIARLEGHAGTLAHPGIVYRVLFRAGGRELVSCGYDGTIRLWDIAGGRQLRQLTGHAGAVTALALSGDGRTLVSGGADRTVRVWDLDTYRQTHKLEGHHGPVRGVAVAADGRRAVSGGNDSQMRLWDLAQGRELKRFGKAGTALLSVDLAADGSLALAADIDGGVASWDVDSGLEVRRFAGHARSVRCAVLSADLTRHAVGQQRRHHEAVGPQRRRADRQLRRPPWRRDQCRPLRRRQPRDLGRGRQPRAELEHAPTREVVMSSEQATKAPTTPLSPTGLPLVAENAFRVLGTSVAASRADLQTASAAMRRAARLSVVKPTEWDFAWIGPLDRGDGAIQAASGRLADTERRLIDRLFWFGPGAQAWIAASAKPPPAGEAADDLHDRALLRLLQAAAGDPLFNDKPRWVAAIDAWARAVGSDGYWTHVLDLDRRGGFEPAANADDAGAVRRHGVDLALAAVLGAAKADAIRGEGALVGRVAAILRGTALPEETIVAWENQILGPMEENIRELCQDIRAQWDKTVVRENTAAAANRQPCAALAKRLDTELVPRLERLERSIGKDDVFARRSRGEVAQCFSMVAGAWTWADDFDSSEALLKRATGFAAGTPAEERVRAEVQRVATPAQYQRDHVKPVEKAPRLRTVNGIGLNFYSLDRPYPVNPAWVYGTLYVVILFVPVIPLKRYLASRSPGGGWYFHATLRFGVVQWLQLLLSPIVGAVMVVVFFGIIFGIQAILHH